MATSKDADAVMVIAGSVTRAEMVAAMVERKHWRTNLNDKLTLFTEVATIAAAMVALVCYYWP